MTELISVEVVYALAEQQWIRALELPAGTTAGEAVEASGLLELIGADQLDPERLGIFSQKVSPEYVLRDGDRVEIYRPLRMEPMEARRLRAAGKGAS